MNILTGKLVLTLKQRVAIDTLKLRFKPQSLSTLTGEVVTTPFVFAPGQFVSIGFTAKAWRAYSIASTPAEAEIELLVRLVADGVGSEAFRLAEVGDAFEFKGPFGHFVLSDTPNAHLVFCATGTGIAPFRSMIKAESESTNPRTMTLLYGGKNAEDLGYLDELKPWSDKLHIQLGLSRDPELTVPAGLEGTAHHSRITALLENFDYPPNVEFYLCGNGAMVVSVQEILEAKQIPKDKIFMERFN